MPIWEKKQQCAHTTHTQLNKQTEKLCNELHQLTAISAIRHGALEDLRKL